MITFMHPLQSPFRYKALSTDEKPTDATYGSMLLEEDTGVWFIFYGGVWSVASTSSFDPSSGTLTVYHDVGEGEDWGEDVKGVVIADTVRSIGAGAFASLESLEYVSIPAGVEVEDGAFSQTFKDPFDADIAMADVAGYEYVAYEGVMYQADPSLFNYYAVSTIDGFAAGVTGVVNIAVPTVHEETAVTRIATNAFSGNTDIVRVICGPNSKLESIGSNTFKDCTSLACAVLPDTLSLIEYRGFCGCRSMTVFECEGPVTYGSSFAQGCSSMVMNLSPKTAVISVSSFNGCAALSELVFPETITRIDSWAFSDCNGITKVTFAEGFNPATLDTTAFRSWTFYAADGTTVIDKTVASNLAGKTFKGSASRLVEDAGPVPGMEGRYMYAITTDDAGMNILSVQAGHDGRPLDTIVTASTRRQGAENIPDEWDFENGVGPFKCWYGAFNIQDYVAGTEDEEPVCTGAGMLAYRLDPYDLGMTMGGTTLQGTYNVFLVVPTVYWKAVGNILYLSDDASYAGITGMTAYAHTATSDGVETVFPYLGIGVYEAHSEDGILMSVPGVSPTVNLSHDQFKDLADALTPAEGSGFQQWNFFQWTLFKMMAYLVMGTKNSQWMLGNGPVSGSAASATGLADSAGPYADSTSQYDKVFIENSWGSVWSFVGDTCLKAYVLHAGNALGGAVLGGQPEVDGAPALPSLGGAGRWVQSASRSAAAWDLPATADTNTTASDPAKTGDQVWANAAERCFLAGGGWDYGSLAGVACVSGNAVLSIRDSGVGSRLAYLMAADAAAEGSRSAKALGKALSAPDSDDGLAERRAVLAEVVAQAQEEAAMADDAINAEEPAEELAEEPEEEPVEEPAEEEPAEEPAEESDEEPVAEESDEPAVEEGTIDL